MNAVLLSIHVIAAIVLIGPITVASSLFPRYARGALASEPTAAASRAVAGAMRRISHAYAMPALAVPVFGIAVGAGMGVLGEAWVIVSMALTAVAAGLLVARIDPLQTRVLASLDEGDAAGAARDVRVLAMTSGLFALTWAVVVVLMIVRPGSSTGV